MLYAGRDGLRLRWVLACFMMYVRTCERLGLAVWLALVIAYRFVVHHAPSLVAGVLYILLHPYLVHLFEALSEL